MGLNEEEDESSLYMLEKSGVVDTLGFLADSEILIEDCSKRSRELKDMIHDIDGRSELVLRNLIKELILDIDVAQLYIKQSKYKLLSLTNDQLPF